MQSYLVWQYKKYHLTDQMHGKYCEYLANTFKLLADYSQQRRKSSNDAGPFKIDKIYQFNWRVKFIIWDEKFKISQLEEEISKANISIIPSDPNDPIKSGVSHNRLVDSVRGGCITIASPMESYKELDGLALLGDNFGELLSKAIGDYERLRVQLENDRDQKLRLFSPEYNLRAWKNFWSNLMKQVSILNETISRS